MATIPTFNTPLIHNKAVTVFRYLTLLCEFFYEIFFVSVFFRTILENIPLYDKITQMRVFLQFTAVADLIDNSQFYEVNNFR